MSAIFLKLRVLFFASCLLSLGARAQNPRFIYIQTDTKEPFYVKIDKRFLNSSATGYIIIAKLAEDNYHLSIGFPDNEWPEMNVTVSVKDGNTGFLLKRSADKGWSMFNLLTMKSMVVEKQLPPTKEAETVLNTDEFARTLAEVVNDPSIAQVIIEKKPVEVPVKTDDNKTVKVPDVKEEIKAIPVNLKTNDIAIGKKIEKLSQDTTSEGLLIAYRDIANTDTVKIFMPVSKTEIVKAPADTVTKKTEVAKKDPGFIDMELQNPNLKTDSGTIQKDDFVITQKRSETAAMGQDPNKGMINSDCKRSATQNDFLNLRKQMAAESSEKDMTKAAIKQFISTCYTAEQVKILGALFITEEGKYKFFVAAFPHVWDTGNFSALEDQLKEEYYKTRFKAMFRH
jgi:hypothetical protein